MIGVFLLIAMMTLLPLTLVHLATAPTTAMTRALTTVRATTRAQAATIAAPVLMTRARALTIQAQVAEGRTTNRVSYTEHSSNQ